jgi:hypothetical protein
MFGEVRWRGACVLGADGRFRRAARGASTVGLKQSKAKMLCLLGGRLPGPPVGARDAGPVLTGHAEHLFSYFDLGCQICGSIYLNLNIE